MEDKFGQHGQIKDVSFRAYAERPYDGVGFYIRARSFDDRMAFAKLEWVEVKQEDIGRTQDPFFSVCSWEEHPSSILMKDGGGTVLQVLMDDLWNCGIRPTEGKGSAGQLVAVQDHLKDMRKIAEKFLKVNLP